MGVTVKLPVPVEQIVEHILGLNFDWDEIEERPGEQILGGLLPPTAKSYLNSKHLPLFEQKPGLERSTIGHEAGHWDIDIDRASWPTPRSMDSTWPPGGPAARQESRNADQGLVPGHDRRPRLPAIQVAHRGAGHPEVRSAVDRYQSAALLRWPNYSQKSGTSETLGIYLCRAKL